MATHAEIQAAKLQQPAFVRAAAVEQRLTDAIDTATFNRARLLSLRKQLRWEIINANARDMELWLAMYRQAIDHHISVAFHTFAEEDLARPAETYVPAVAA